MIFEIYIQQIMSLFGKILILLKEKHSNKIVSIHLFFKTWTIYEAKKVLILLYLFKLCLLSNNISYRSKHFWCFYSVKKKIDKLSKQYAVLLEGNVDR